MTFQKLINNSRAKHKGNHSREVLFNTRERVFYHRKIYLRLNNFLIDIQ